MITETDHMFMRPPKNVATEEKPVGFGFYYMISTDPKLLPVVKKFLKPEIDVHTVDAVGPSPLIIHKPMLEKVAEPWWKLSLEMKHDSAANTVFGWVLEMWGYNLAARNLGIRHTVLQDLQVTGRHYHYHCHLCHLTSSIIPLQVEPQGIGTDEMDTKDIYHYTFGLVLSGGGRSWRLDKRMYYGGYPADHLQMPPACTAKSGFIMAGLWNEAAQGIEGWPNRVAKPREDGHADTPLARLLSITPDDGAALPPLAKLLRGTGPWEWGGAGKRSGDGGVVGGSGGGGGGGGGSDDERTDGA